MSVACPQDTPIGFPSSRFSSCWSQDGVRSEGRSLWGYGDQSNPTPMIPPREFLQKRCTDRTIHAQGTFTPFVAITSVVTFRLSDSAR